MFNEKLKKRVIELERDRDEYRELCLMEYKVKLKEKIRKIESELQHTLDEEQDSFIIATTTKSYFYVHMLFKKLLEED